MKDSAVSWIGQAPKHWSTLPLKHWITINTRVLPETTDPEFVFWYVDIGSVGTGILIQKPQRLRFADAPSRARRIVCDGDTLVSTVRTYLKAIYFVDSQSEDLICSTGFAVLTPRVGTVPKFVSYLARSVAFTDHVTAESVGIAYPSVSEGRLGSFQVAVPPLSEQHAIVRFLDHANRNISRYIDAKRKLIGLLEEQRRTIIRQAVTRGLDSGVPLKDSGVEWLGEVPAHWSVIALRHRYSQCLGKMLDSKRIKGDHSLPYLRNSDIQWDRINIDDLPKMDILPDEYERYTVRDGDLLVCEGGEVGRCALWSGELSMCGFQKALHRLRPKNINRDAPRFMHYVLRAAVSGNAFSDGHVSTIEHLTGEKIRAHRFPFPLLLEQSVIVQYLDKATGTIDTAIDRTRRQIELMEEYRTRLTSDVVTGKIDVREAAAQLSEQPEEVKDDQ